METEKMDGRPVSRFYQNRSPPAGEGRPLCCDDILEVKGGFRTLDCKPGAQRGERHYESRGGDAEHESIRDRIAKRSGRENDPIVLER